VWVCEEAARGVRDGFSMAMATVTLSMTKAMGALEVCFNISDAGDRRVELSTCRIIYAATIPLQIMMSVFITLCLHNS